MESLNEKNILKEEDKEQEAEDKERDEIFDQESDDEIQYQEEQKI